MQHDNKLNNELTIILIHVDPCNSNMNIKQTLY